MVWYSRPYTTVRTAQVMWGRTCSGMPLWWLTNLNRVFELAHQSRAKTRSANGAGESIPEIGWSSVEVDSSLADLLNIKPWTLKLSMIELVTLKTGMMAVYAFNTESENVWAVKGSPVVFLLLNPCLGKSLCSKSFREVWHGALEIQC